MLLDFAAPFSVDLPTEERLARRKAQGLSHICVHPDDIWFSRLRSLTRQKRGNSIAALPSPVLVASDLLPLFTLLLPQPQGVYNGHERRRWAHRSKSCVWDEQAMYKSEILSQACTVIRCTLHAARCTLHAARCTPHAARCTLHAARCTLHAARCTVSTPRCTLHAPRCTHAARATLHAARCTLHAARCTPARCTPARCTSPRCTSPRCTLHATRCTPHATRHTPHAARPTPHAARCATMLWPASTRPSSRRAPAAALSVSSLA